ncbi:Cytochrome C oxidase, cbb3-type, subunit III [Hymenobacter daecheongensis DSM 21074]|uniref:Cytochrome C oxidase, cbb3-type, subunit III n=1 Tax=Hymenobacter daecheongensis DSM 21074 TaxID=1121955 RepID=A0A1M6E6W3_9BACT|nr:cytochrome c [Hymenobacter daecheongensis]SHI81100.1 Cytochrome C oxidase, cbb3-type, subunit III [Hymenobacter daecheongensis DSM 21074]
MKKLFRVLGFTLAGLIFLAACAATFVSVRGIPKYAMPKPTMAAIAYTPARVTQGEKLVNSMCADCHLDRKTRMLSGRRLDDLPPEFGTLYAANITQDPTHGIGRWTDAELVGLLRTGIGRDGRFRIVMPSFVHMSDEDVHSVIAYLRSSAAPVQPNATPSHPQEPSFLSKALVNTVMKPTPLPTRPVVAPSPTDAVAYGRYLVVGRYKCYDCHSHDFKTNNSLEPEKSEGYLAGGTKLLTPTGQEIIAPNLTSDPETGLGNWTETQFVQAVRYGQSPHGPLQMPMPKFTLMDEGEAKAIFAYLRTVPTIKNATPGDGAVAAR